MASEVAAEAAFSSEGVRSVVGADRRLATAEAQKRTFKAEVATIDKQVVQLVDRIAAAAETPSIVTVYEDRIRQLEERNLLLTEKIATAGQPARGPGGLISHLEPPLTFLENPSLLWDSDRLEDKRGVSRLIVQQKQDGAPGGIRTPDQWLRKPLLYPAELRAR